MTHIRKCLIQYTLIFKQDIIFINLNEEMHRKISAFLGFQDAE